MAFVLRVFFLFIGAPLALYCVFFICTFLFKRYIGKINFKSLNWLFVLLLFLYIILVFTYLFSNLYLDPISPSLVSTSAFFIQGKEVYHNLSAPFIYSLLYGPIAYVINGFFMLIFGASMFSSKVGSVVSLFLSLILIFYSLKNWIRKENLYLFFGVVSGLFLLFWTYSFEARVDVMSLLFSSLALFGAMRKKEISSIVIVGIAIGLGINLKISGIFYFLPALFLLWENFKIRSVISSCCIAFVSAAIPFFAFGNVNFGNYLLWLGLAGKHGLDGGSFANNIGYTVFFFIPLIPILFSRYTKDFSKNALYIVVLAVGMLITSIFASKVGSGQNHLLPFVPFLVYGYGIFYGEQNEKTNDNNLIKFFIIPFLLVILFISFVTTFRVFRLYSIYPTKAKDDINYILDKYKTSPVYMGYSESSGDSNLFANLPSFRPLFLFAGKNYLLDRAAFADFREAGGTLSPDFLENLKKCKDDIWVFPKNTKPFEGMLGYGKPLFDDTFIQTFNENFRIQESIEYYDVWRCNKSNMVAL